MTRLATEVMMTTPVTTGRSMNLNILKRLGRCVGRMCLTIQWNQYGLSSTLLARLIQSPTGMADQINANGYISATARRSLENDEHGE